jgi:hypothetical protein
MGRHRETRLIQCSAGICDERMNALFLIYLASSLGFSPELKSYRDKIKQRLYELGCTVLDPWEQPLRPEIEEASATSDWHARVKAFRKFRVRLGKHMRT